LYFDRIKRMTLQLELPPPPPPVWLDLFTRLTHTNAISMNYRLSLT